jgi:O-antigen/teichoic acid export membrane protein
MGDSRTFKVAMLASFNALSRLLGLIGVVTGSVAAVLLPDLAMYHKNGRLAEAVSLWKRGAAK